MSRGVKGKEGEPGESEASERRALFCLSLFVHRYLAAIYGALTLDLVSLSLLDEIARHNLEPLRQAGLAGFPRDAAQIGMMRGCNAFSLSQATGVPRETVRRKIKQLMELGWVEQHNRKGLFITTKWMDRISREEAAGILAEFRDAARKIEDLLKA